MTKSATDIMQEILFAAVVDSVMAMKDAAKGVPNTLLREINGVHANITFADLPPHVQAAIGASVRTAFNKLLMTRTEQRLFDLLREADGVRIALPGDSPEEVLQQQEYLFSRIVTIYGGSQQMQLITVARHVLGLRDG